MSIEGEQPGRRGRELDDLLRELTPHVLGALVRKYGHFDMAEDAVQEALLAAATQWPDEGQPDNPRGWLITVASRRLTDLFRSDEARRNRELGVAALEPDAPTSSVDEPDVGGEDDTLALLFLCCHPSLSPPSQVALTLRAVGGLTTAEIAAAFLVPEATMAQRISRAKRQVKQAGAHFRMPRRDEWEDRLAAVLHVLYLIFNEGYTASSGDDLHRPDLTAESIRLARSVYRQLPADGEVAGLLALMILTDARSAARTGADGSLIPLEEQDRTLWNRDAIAEGIAIVSAALSDSALGPYQVQAAISALHDESASSAETDWAQIVELYRLLEQVSPGPMVTLNHAVAVATVDGPQAGLDLLATLDGDTRLAEHHRLSAVRAHLLELAGQRAQAREHYLAAANRTTSAPEQRYLRSKAQRLE